MYIRKFKRCPSCNTRKRRDEFSTRTKSTDGLQRVCKECNKSYYHANRDRHIAKSTEWKQANWNKHLANNRASAKRCQARANEYAAYRRAAIRQATPAWVDRTKVLMVYKKARDLGLTVDHIVPLISSTVCGLHCWENLQLLDKSLNSSKQNLMWPDMP